MSTGPAAGDAPAVAPSCVPCEGIGCAFSASVHFRLVWTPWTQVATQWHGTGGSLVLCEGGSPDDEPHSQCTLSFLGCLWTGPDASLAWACVFFLFALRA